LEQRLFFSIILSSAISGQQSAVSNQQSVISDQRSAISFIAGVDVAFSRLFSALSLRR